MLPFAVYFQFIALHFFFLLRYSVSGYSMAVAILLVVLVSNCNQSQLLPPLYIYIRKGRRQVLLKRSAHICQI